MYSNAIDLSPIGRRYFVVNPGYGLNPESRFLSKDCNANYCIMKYLTQAAVITVLSCFTAFGQPLHHRDGHRAGTLDESFTAEQIATLKSKKMALHLDLNAAQEKQIYSLHLERAKAQLALREARRERQKNAEGRPSSDERYQHMIENMERQQAFQNALKGILNEKQYEQWRANHAQGQKARRKDGKGRRTMDRTKRRQR